MTDVSLIITHSFELTDNRETSLHIFDDCPVVTKESFLSNNVLCKENICGNYGKKASCPPFVISMDDCLAEMKEYHKCAIFVMNISSTDPKSIEEESARLRSICSSISLKLRSLNINNRALAGGPCSVCNDCSNTNKCQHPERMVASASGFGVPVLEYIESKGLKKNDAVRLYGIIFF